MTRGPPRRGRAPARVCTADPSSRGGAGASGFSLVEVILAFVILGLAVLPVLQLFTGAGRQARQTSDHGLAAVVTEKVAEDLRLAAWENEHSVRTQDTVPPDALSVLDGISPHFARLEDVVPPYGRIQPGVDPAITQSRPSLYKELRTFHVGVSSAARVLPVTGEVLDVTVRTEWTDFSQRSLNLPLPVTLGRFVPASPPDRAVDRAWLDGQIRERLYPAYAGRTLAQAVAAAGASLDVMRDLGDIVVVMRSLKEADDASLEEMARLRGPATGSVTAIPWRTRIAMARCTESRLVGQLLAFALLAGPVQRLAAIGRPVPLGREPPHPGNYQRELLGAAWLPSSFVQTLGLSAEHYVAAYNDPTVAMPPRLRVRIFMKVLELAKLQVLTLDPDVSALNRMLLDFRQDQDGRNPNFVAFADAELKICESAATLQAAYPAPWRHRSWQEYLSGIVPLVPRLLRPKR